MIRIWLIGAGLLTLLVSGCFFSKKSGGGSRSFKARLTLQPEPYFKPPVDTTVFWNLRPIPGPTPILQFGQDGGSGQTPRFYFELYPSGLATLTAFEWVEKKGAYWAYFTQAETDSLLAQTRSSGFFEWKNHYPTDGPVLPDLPRFSMQVDTHRVEWNYLAPPEVSSFFRRLSEGLLQRQWKPLGEF